MSKKTLQLIVSQGNDYVVCAKANQKRLYRWIEQQWRTAQPCSHFCHTERGHGRTLTWTVAVFDALGNFAQVWAGLARLIVVERQGTRSGKPFAERQYYISSASLSAAAFHSIIRGHWGIENHLHWVKDVVLGEDRAPHAQPDAAVNWSILRNLFIHLAGSLGFTSMTTAKRKLANQWERVLSFLQ